MSLKCNICWRELEGEAYLALSCSHIFCIKDAEQYFSREPVCPVCDTRLRSRNGLVKLNLQVNAEKTIALCGLAPKKILEISTKAIEFYNYQKNTEMQYHEQESKTLKEECERAEANGSRQLLEAQSQIKKLSHQLEREHKERDRDRDEISLLQKKLESAQALASSNNNTHNERGQFTIDSDSPMGSRSFTPRNQNSRGPVQLVRPLTDNPNRSGFKSRPRTPLGISKRKKSTMLSKSPAVSTTDRFAMVRQQTQQQEETIPTSDSIRISTSGQPALFTPRFFQTSQRSQVSYMGSSNFLLRSSLSTPQPGELFGTPKHPNN